MTRAIALAALLLTGCGSSSVYDDWSDDDVAAAADGASADAETALMRIEELTTRVNQLETRAADLESEVTLLKVRADGRESVDDAMISDLESLADAYNSHTH